MKGWSKCLMVRIIALFTTFLRLLKTDVLVMWTRTKKPLQNLDKKLMNLVTGDMYEWNCLKLYQRTIEDPTSTLKRTVVDIYAEHRRRKGIFTFIFHPLHPLRDYLSRFGSLKYPEASALEQFNVAINLSSRTSSMGNGTSMQYVVKDLDGP